VPIYLNAQSPDQVTRNAFLKLCKMDVAAETERWARTGKAVLQLEV
jgi:hypothetical protein